MKKHFSLALLLAAALLFSACSFNLPPIGSLTTTTAGSGGSGPEQPSGPVYDEDTNTYGFYYDQLTDNEKAIYRAIYKNARTKPEIAFALKTPLVITTAEAEGDDAHTAAINTALKQIIQPAMDALAYDHPEISWMSYGGADGSSFSISIKSENKDGNKVSEIGALTFIMKLKDGITQDTIDDYEAQINAVIDEIIAPRR